jgi:hypothetical protein
MALQGKVVLLVWDRSFTLQNTIDTDCVNLRLVPRWELAKLAPQH